MPQDGCGGGGLGRGGDQGSVDVSHLGASGRQRVRRASRVAIEDLKGRDRWIDS